MKTAMQELMDYLNEDSFDGICDIRDRVEELFEKEKEQIIQSYNDGYVNKAFDKPRNPLEYYNQTYNQNK